MGGGKLGQKLEAIVADFNASQGDHVVVPTCKGTYPETMIAAFRAGEQPAIVQVFEVGTGTMTAAEGAVYPVHQIMTDMGETFDPAGFLPSAVSHMTALLRNPRGGRVRPLSLEVRRGE